MHGARPGSGHHMCIRGTSSARGPRVRTLVLLDGIEADERFIPVEKSPIIGKRFKGIVDLSCSAIFEGRIAH